MVLTKEDSIKATAFIKRGFAKISTIQKDIQNGDIITRVGNDFTSECLRQINVRNKTWSHCGIASIEHDSIFVYHALGGEFNPDQQSIDELKNINIDSLKEGIDKGIQALDSAKQMLESIKNNLLLLK